MALFNFTKPKNSLEEGGRSYIQRDIYEQTRKCPNCRKEISESVLENNKLVCECGYHFRLNSRQRINMIADKDSFTELFGDIISRDPLNFPGYKEKLHSVKNLSGENESVICGRCKVNTLDTCIFAMDPRFMMGSMGSATGERITSLFEYALKNRLPVIGFSLSGGARMQEGLLSLMQMAKTSAAVKRHSDASLLFISVLTDPTTGGVTASFAMEGDIIISEPGATVGFAGARVIEQTIRKPLSKEFQKAEFVLEHGFVDIICNRSELKKTLYSLLKLHTENK